VLSQIYCEPNLVPNNCFEKGVIKDGVEQQPYGCQTIKIQDYLANWHWAKNELGQSTPDWISVSIHNNCEEDPVAVTIYPNKFVRSIAGEGIRCELTSNLVKNSWYQLRLDYGATTNNNEDAMKIYLSPWGTLWNSTPYRKKISDYAHLANGGVWQPYHKILILPENNVLDNLIIINKGKPEGSYGNRVHLDNLILIPDCPELPSLKFQNTNFWIDESSYPFAARDYIYAGYDVGATTLDKGDVIVHKDAKVTFIAGQDIILDSDPTYTTGSFRVEEGGEFYAYISPCDAGCPLPATDAMLNNFEICDINPVQIGIPPDPINTYNYQWNMLSNCNGIDEPTALSYLSSSTVSNPDFTPPTGTGSIVYELTITNGCGNTLYEDVTINYTNTPFDCNSYVTAEITTNPNHFYDPILIDFTAGAKTQEIIIQLFHNSSLISEYTLTKGADFCDAYTFNVPSEDVDNCYDYIIVIKDRNMCCTTYTTQTLFWDRNQSYTAPPSIPNIFCAGECYSIPDLGGAVHYEMKMNLYPEGDLVFTGSGELTDNNQCLWDGTCNAPGCINDHVNSDEWYAGVLTLTDCDGNTHPVPHLPLSLLIRYADCGFKIINNGAKDSLNLSSVVISPNPSSGKFTISYGTLQPTIYIYNCLGKLVCIMEKAAQGSEIIDLSANAKGIYFIKVQTAINIYTEKVIVE